MPSCSQVATDNVQFAIATCSQNHHASQPCLRSGILLDNENYFVDIVQQILANVLAQKQFEMIAQIPKFIVWYTKLSNHRNPNCILKMSFNPLF